MTSPDKLASQDAPDGADKAFIAASIRAQAHKRPLDLAISAGASRLTFAEMIGWADALANALAAQPQDGPVAVLLPSGAALPVAVIGLLLARRTYVLIDADFPEHRVRRILDHAGAQAVLCDSSTASLAQAAAGSAAACIFMPERPAAPISPVGPSSDSDTPDRIAAISYTSGSTGEPKGVVRTVGALSTRARIFAADGGLGPDDRVPILQPITVGPSLQRLLGSLSVGAQIRIIDLKHIGLAAALDALADFRPTVMFMVPSVFRALFRAGEATAAAIGGQMRWIRLSGDRVLHADVDLYRRRFPATTRLLITIGSNEAHTYASWFLDHATVLDRPLVPVGYPREDIDLKIVAEDGAPVKTGEAGEIVIANDRLARGYWRDETMTNARFVTASQGSVFFHTGDFGRFLPSGLLEFVGRRDRQVKVRGNTVHLAEVEAALDFSPAVAEAAVVVRSEAGETKLIAYCEGVLDADLPAVRDIVRQRLPAAMRPAHLVVVDALPRLPSGKVDMGELERLDRERPGPSAPIAATVAGSSMTSVLRGCWNDILGAGAFESGATFEDCGGQSIAAMEILLLLERRLGRRLSFEMMDPRMTPDMLVRRLEDLDAAPEGMPEDDDAPLLLLFPQFYGAGFDLRGFQQLLTAHFRVLVCDYVDAEDGMIGSISADEYFAGIARRVASAGPPRRLWLVGYVFGCRVAAEAARRLAAQGVAIEFVGLIAGATPRAQEKRRLRLQPAAAPLELRRTFYRSRLEFFISRLANVAARGLQRMGAASVLQVGIAFLARIGFRSAANNTFVASRRRAAEAAFGNLPAGRLDMPVTVFVTHGPKSESYYNPDLGWGEICSRLTVAPLVGGRKRILAAEGGEEMVALLADIELKLRTPLHGTNDKAP